MLSSLITYLFYFFEPLTAFKSTSDKRVVYLRIKAILPNYCGDEDAGLVNEGAGK
jgi:hypothetical protein